MLGTGGRLVQYLRGSGRERGYEENQETSHRTFRFIIGNSRLLQVQMEAIEGSQEQYLLSYMLVEILIAG